MVVAPFHSEYSEKCPEKERALLSATEYSNNSCHLLYSTENPYHARQSHVDMI